MKPRAAAPQSAPRGPLRRFAGAIFRLLPTLDELRAHWTAFLVCGGAGLLMRLPYPKLNWWWVAWIGLVPFFMELRWGRPRRVVFYMGWLFGFAFYYSNVSWLNVLIFYNPLVPLGILIMGLSMGFLIGAWALGAEACLRRAPWLAWLVAPALWVALEWWRNIGALAFPWTFLATSQFWFPPAIQIADLTGVWGLSFLIALVNWAIAMIIPPYHDIRRITWAQRFVPLGVAVVLTAGVMGYGLRALSRDYGNGEALRVAILQPGVPQKKKFASYGHPDENVQRRLQTEINQEAFAMIEAAPGAGDIDLIVLPETAFPSMAFNLQKSLLAQLRRQSREKGVPILFGASEMKITSPRGIPIEEWEEGSTYEVYNCAYLVAPTTGSLTVAPEIYRKMQLVPFGETVPYLSAIPGFAEYIVGIGQFAPGPAYTVFETPQAAFAAVICFESAFAYLFREMNRRGAEVNFVLTNDGWYEQSAGPYQHFVMSGFRAVEGRRSVVRAANNGVSAAFDPKGQIIEQIPLDRKDMLIASVPLNSGLTIYQRWGDWFAYACVALALGGLGWVAVQARKKPEG